MFSEIGYTDLLHNRSSLISRGHVWHEYCWSGPRSHPIRWLSRSSWPEGVSLLPPIKQLRQPKDANIDIGASSFLYSGTSGTSFVDVITSCCLLPSASSCASLTESPGGCDDNRVWRAYRQAEGVSCWGCFTKTIPGSHHDKNQPDVAATDGRNWLHLPI